MLETGERLHRANHSLLWNAGNPRHSGSGHDVGDQMPADQPNRRQGHQRRIDRKEHLPRAPCTRERERVRIVGVDHRPVVRGLIRKDLRLRCAVLLHRTVTIEMVRGQVQQDRNPWMKRVGRLELKAAHLDDMERLGRGVGHLRAQGRSDVSADQRPQAAGVEHAPGQRRRRRLALRSGDRHDPSAQPARRELDLSHDRNAGVRAPRRSRADRAARPGSARSESAEVNVARRCAPSSRPHAGAAKSVFLGRVRVRDACRSA